MQFAAMFAHDAKNDGQTKTGADAGRLVVKTDQRCALESPGEYPDRRR